MRRAGNTPNLARGAGSYYQMANPRSIADAVIRFVSTEDPGSGFVEPYPRSEPAGGGGTHAGCDDPAL